MISARSPLSKKDENTITSEMKNISLNNKENTVSHD